MQIIQVTVENYNSLITECFSSDPNYLKFHYEGAKGLDACIEITVNELKAAPSECLFKVVDGDKTVAMFGVENGNMLNPFFIKPEFRKKEFVGPILELVRSKLTKNYMMGLYDVNEPIKNFMLKNGGSISITGVYKGHLVHILEFSNGSV